MAIKTRPVVSARRQSRQPVRRPPTQSVLSLAAYALADELGGRDVDQATRDNAASQIYDFAAKSVATAWSLVDAAIMGVRCYSGRRKVSGARGEVVDPFLAELDKAKAGDIKTRSELIEQVKTAEGEAKEAIEKELGELLLRGIPQGRPFRLGEKASAFLLDAMFGEFLPVKGSPMAVEDFPRFVQENLRFLDWIGSSLLFTEEQVAEFLAAKEADKAASATAAASPAPEADAEESSDEDAAEGEEEAASA